MPRIAISYRRDDSAAVTGRIFDRLVAHYGVGSVFRDIDNIPLGVDFREHINTVLARTDITLVVVGKRWPGPQPRRRRRIDDPADPVRVEVETALRNGMPVVPVLVEGAAMPNVEQLPDSLKELVYRNGLEVNSGRDFDQHIERLIRSMEPILARRAEELAEGDGQRGEAARQAEEEKQRTEAARQAEEEKQRTEAARQAEEEKQRTEAARRTEEEKQQAEAARQTEQEKRRAEAARRAEEEKRRAEAPRLGTELNLSSPPPKPNLVRSGVSRLWMFAGIFVGAGILFVVVLILSLSSGPRTAKVSVPESSSPSSFTAPPSPPSTAKYPTKNLDYRDPKTTKQIIDSLGR